MTFAQRRSNVFEVGPSLYKCYTNILCSLDREPIVLTQNIIYNFVTTTTILDSHQATVRITEKPADSGDTNFGGK